jgi:hypothetical protein
MMAFLLECTSHQGIGVLNTIQDNRTNFARREKKMEVTVDAIDWNKLTAFQPLGSYFDDYLFEVEEYPDWILSGPEHGWKSDSYGEYTRTVEILEHLKKHVDSRTLNLIKDGITPLISENSQLDELGTGPITDNCWWISITPDSTKKIYQALNQIDFAYLADTLRKHPPETEEYRMPSVQEDCFNFIKQHLAIIEKAVERGYGLLGHVG